MPEKREYIWVVTVTDPDPGRHDSTAYRTEKSATQAAAQAAASLAGEELQAFEFEGDEAAPLESCLKNYEDGKFQEALDDWQEYADDHSSERNVLVDQIEILD